MFRLAQATVHYGMSSYPLNGLPPSLEQVESADALDPEDLMLTVGRLTSFPRPFRVVHCERQEFDLPSGVLVIDERIVALADGYTITWIKEEVQ